MRDGKIIDHIDVVLENCEVITLPANVVGSMHFDIVTDKVYVNNYLGTLTSRRSVIIDDLQLHILAKGNKTIEQVWKPKNTMTIFDRFLEFPDIVYLDVYYADTSMDEYEVVWEDLTSGGENNKLQSTKITDAGDCIITISRINADT